MNDTAALVINTLAEKLGVTAEHLWGVLVKQALISGLCGLVGFIASVGALWWAAAWIRSKTSVARNEDRWGPPAPEGWGKRHAAAGPQPCDAGPEWGTGGAIVAWVVWGLMAFLTLLEAENALPLAISAFVNPEYWALQQVLHP